MEIPISNRSNIMINADDFGMNHRASRNILFLISIGKIDRVSVMIDEEITEKEILALLQSGVKIDIHLSAGHISSSKSTIVRIFNFILNLSLGKISKTKIRKKWSGQIEKFIKLFGKNPDGINSHEHIHFFPSLFSVALDIQNEYMIPYIRFGTHEKSGYRNFTGMILLILRKINFRKLKSSSAISSNYLVNLDWITNIDKFLKELPEGQTEIVCHPERAQEFVLIKDEF